MRAERGTLATMRQRLLQRFFLILGMVAMLGALVSAPLTVTYAFARAGMASPPATTVSAAADEMPCHKPAKQKHCPDCPQKVCPELGTCLVKCFQPLFQPVSVSGLQGESVRAGVVPIRSAAATGSLIPPLLRPPSV